MNDAQSDIAKQTTETSVIHREESSIHIGPLPSPEDFAKYNSVLADAAERIMAMCEKEGEHRRSCELAEMTADIKMIESSQKNARLGQKFGFVITMTSILSFCFLAYMGKSLESIAPAIVALASIIVALRGQKNRTREEDTSLRDAE